MKRLDDCSPWRLTKRKSSTTYNWKDLIFFRNIEKEDSKALISEGIAEIAKQDCSYQNLIKYVVNGFPENKNHLSKTMKPFHNIEDYLSIDNDLVLYNERIFISTRGRKQVLKELHSSHQGMERTKI